MIRMCTLDEIFAASEFAFQEHLARTELLCQCGCNHPGNECTCGLTEHDYQPSGIRIEACTKCGLPNVPDHPCRAVKNPAP